MIFIKTFGLVTSFDPKGSHQFCWRQFEFAYSFTSVSFYEDKSLEMVSLASCQYYEKYYIPIILKQNSIYLKVSGSFDKFGGILVFERQSESDRAGQCRIFNDVGRWVIELEVHDVGEGRGLRSLQNLQQIKPILKTKLKEFLNLRRLHTCNAIVVTNGTCGTKKLQWENIKRKRNRKKKEWFAFPYACNCNYIKNFLV